MRPAPAARRVQARAELAVGADRGDRVTAVAAWSAKSPWPRRTAAAPAAIRCVAAATCATLGGGSPSTIASPIPIPASAQPIPATTTPASAARPTALIGSGRRRRSEPPRTSKAALTGRPWGLESAFFALQLVWPTLDARAGLRLPVGALTSPPAGRGKCSICHKCCQGAVLSCDPGRQCARWAAAGPPSPGANVFTCSTNTPRRALSRERVA
jgi:hypothetical protein